MFEPDWGWLPVSPLIPQSQHRRSELLLEVILIHSIVSIRKICNINMLYTKYMSIVYINPRLASTILFLKEKITRNHMFLLRLCFGGKYKRIHFILLAIFNESCIANAIIINDCYKAVGRHSNHLFQFHHGCVWNMYTYPRGAQNRRFKCHRGRTRTQLYYWWLQVKREAHDMSCARCYC